MSTTGGTPQGTLLMLDPPDVIRKKLKSAVTDSGTDVRRAADKPGVTNLIDIMTVATGESPEAIEARYDSGGYGQFKTDVAEAVIALFEPIQARFPEVRGDTGELTRLLRVGADKARAVAAPRSPRRCTSAWASCRGSASPGDPPLAETLDLGGLELAPRAGLEPFEVRPA